MKPVYYDCEICGHYHPWDWNGDCRDDNNRFNCNEIDHLHRKTGYEIKSMDERVAADGNGSVGKELP